VVDIETIRKHAMILPNVTEEPHFEKTSFRINKKIFATYDAKKNRVCLKLDEINQSVFCAFDKRIIYPVDNKWGKQGWTLFEISEIKKEMMIDALNCAYSELLKPKPKKK
jgi:predicted DNA-binding protein (MmcQ/YjbR family)